MSAGVSLQQRHYYEEADPDRALAMLEEEMSEGVDALPDSGRGRTDSGDRACRGLDKLRALLERECEAQVTHPLPYHQPRSQPRDHVPPPGIVLELPQILTILRCPANRLGSFQTKFPNLDCQLMTFSAEEPR